MRLLQVLKGATYICRISASIALRFTPIIEAIPEKALKPRTSNAPKPVLRPSHNAQGNTLVSGK